MNNLLVSLTAGLVGGIAAHTFVVNIPNGMGDKGKIGVAVIQPEPALDEIYIENQDGHGNRLGNLTLGVDPKGRAFIGGRGGIDLIDTDSAFPHPALLSVTNK